MCFSVGVPVSPCVFCYLESFFFFITIPMDIRRSPILPGFAIMFNKIRPDVLR